VQRGALWALARCKGPGAEMSAVVGCGWGADFAGKGGGVHQVSSESVGGVRVEWLIIGHMRGRRRRGQGEGTCARASVDVSGSEAGNFQGSKLSEANSRMLKVLQAEAASRRAAPHCKHVLSSDVYSKIHVTFRPPPICRCLTRLSLLLHMPLAPSCTITHAQPTILPSPPPSAAQPDSDVASGLWFLHALMQHGYPRNRSAHEQGHVSSHPNVSPPLTF